MGSILHRSKKTEDAIIVLGASVDHAPTFSLSHFALGEAYAVAGDFNNSMKHLNTSIKLRNKFSHALKYQNAVLCHIDMLTKMQYAQRYTIILILATRRSFLHIWLTFILNAMIFKTIDSKLLTKWWYLF